MTVRRSRFVDRAPRSYAWWVLGTAVVTTLATVPGQTVGVSVFLDPILGDLDAPRSTVSLLYTLGTLLGAAALPWIGRFIDVRGPRLAVGLIAGAFSLACLYMASVSSLWMLALGFLLIRGLGQGALGLVSTHAVNLWFVRRRGLAVGLMGLGMAAATAFAPPLLTHLVDTVGWRAGYAWLGLGVAALAIPLGVAFFRGAPERYGAEPDGFGRDGGPRTTLTEANMTLDEARRTKEFWIVAAAVMAIAGLSTGQVFHHFDLVALRGVDRNLAAVAFLPLGASAAAGNLAAGALLDRFPPRLVIATMLTLQAVSLALAAFLPSSLLLAYGAILGLTQGINGTVAGAVPASYFGRKHIGSIKGFTSTLSVAGTAAGPVLFAVARDLTGSYTGVLLATAVLPMSLAVLSLGLRPPRAASST